MICYKNKHRKQSINAFSSRKANEIILFIKSGKIRCKVVCSFETELAAIHKSFKNRIYTEEQLNEIQNLLSYRFDFKLIR